MIKSLGSLILVCLFTATPALTRASLVFREIQYNGTLAEDEARFTLDIDAEASGSGDFSATLLTGDLAILPGKIPEALRLVRANDHYQLLAAHTGVFKVHLEMVAKIQRNEPWNQITFTGPATAIASLSAQTTGTGMEIQMLKGTLLDSANTNGVSRIRGFLGADQTIALRWQGKVAEIARKSLLTVDSTFLAQLTPTVIKYASQYHYDMLQGATPQLTLSLPAGQALTRLVGAQIRDWHIVADGARQKLTVEFIKPLETNYDLTIYSEQPIEIENPRARNAFGASGGGAAATLDPPRPLEVERESGALTLSAEDTGVTIESSAGLRQVNAANDALAAYRFNTRPFQLVVRLKSLEPVITVADRVRARLEETRLMAAHDLTLDVRKAGIYSLELVPSAGFAVADVRGDGIEDWRVSDGKLRLNFSARVLGERKVQVQLEQSFKSFPEQFQIAALHVSGATAESARIGAEAVAGLRLKTAALSGLREIAVDQLQHPGNEILAYAAEEPNWSATIASERLPARVVADVFNLLTIGDGILGGSATIRFGLANQGVQEFKIRVPAHCKNVDFTGPNLRRKERNGEVWTIGLQDKAWSGYTLVVTYDDPFDPKGAELPVAGIHALDVERETGSVAITTATSLQLKPKTVTDSLHRVDEQELPAADRALITRPVVIAWQYSGDPYGLTVEVKRYEQADVLEAVADRTQITSVITEAGEMLTQASFMVKNNEKQFQRFRLPSDAGLWGCYVNGQPAKPERDGDWVLVPLPREANRDRASAVDILYAQTNGALAGSWSKNLDLSAPRTDVPNTYAEWQIFVPASLRLSHFGGSMNIAQGTTYELFDAWEKFLGFYIQVIHEMGGAILFWGLLAAFVVGFVITAVKRGWGSLVNILVVISILAILAAMMLPALAKAKARASRISSINNLKQIGLATRIFAGDHNDRMPASFEEMKDELNTDKITYDPESGQRYTYIGGGLSLNDITPDSVVAYGPLNNGLCSALMADGSVQTLSALAFGALNQRGLIQRTAPQQVAAQQQTAVLRGQFANIPTSAAAGVMAPAPAGLRSVRIELPQTGIPFTFTKVLNVGNEPLSIHASVMRYRTYQNWQMAWQTAAFLLGLAVWWWQWRTHRNSFILTVALALGIGSVGSLLIQWRALHDALIIGFPLVTLAIISMLVWVYWPRGEAGVIPPPLPEPPSAAHGNIPPIAAAFAVLLGLGAIPVRGTTVAEPASRIEPPSLVSAMYSGNVNDRVARVVATLQFEGAHEGQVVPLFGGDLVAEEFDVKNGKAHLVPQGGGLAVEFTKNCAPTLRLKLLAKVGGDVTKRQLAFDIPQALSSQVALSLEESEADVDFPAAIAFKRFSEQDKTRVEAVLGSSHRVDLLWTPRVKRAADVAATVFCQNSALITFGGGVINTRATLDYQITQGELRQARICIPGSQRLLRVEASGIRNWEIKNDTSTTVSATAGGSSGSSTAPGVRQVLVVDLLKGVSATWRLALETEQALDGLPAVADVEVPHALDVIRETGLVGLKSAEELGLSVESASDLQRVDAEAFARSGADTAGGLASVFQFSKPEFALRVRAEAVHPEIDATTRNYFRAASDQLSLAATIDYTIKRAGVFDLSIALPDGFRVEHVTGTNILQQSERVENGARVLRVTLKERTLGAYRLGLDLAKHFKELPRSLALTGATPLGTAKLTGFIAVAADPGVAVKTESFDGLTEIPAPALPEYAGTSGGGVLAFRFLSTELKPTTGWKLGVATEILASSVRVEIVNNITLSETLAMGQSLLRYEIANSPLKELRVIVPERLRNVDISGANIRSREQNGNVWRVELQSPTRGFYTLNVSWEQPRLAKTNLVELAGPSAEGVERETGVLAISVKPPLQASVARADNLRHVDAGDVPDWAGRVDVSAALVYRYVRPGYTLALDTRRFDEAEILQTLADNAKLTTVVADDGQMMTELTLSVRNNGRQFLEMELPSHTQVWSAFVGGQAVRPSVHEGKLLLPIQSTSSEDSEIPVQLTYVGIGTFPRTRGIMGLVAPKLDVPLKNAHWEVYLPPDYDYDEFSGTMTREIVTAQTASARFSILDYSRMESESKQIARAESQKEMVEAHRQLAGGKVREANATLNRAKERSYGRDEEEAVRKLEFDVQSAQASNLIHAQNDFSLRNDSSASGEPLSPPTGQMYDNVTAGQQWVKLQQAQELVAAKVEPLRVNLPIRGILIAFDQILQTDTAKPMTIQFSAASLKAVNWPARVRTVLFAFALLWGSVLALLRLTQHSKRARVADQIS